jgi:hypothetical protein
MRRLFWLTLGAVLGAWAVLRVQRFARQFGPRSVAGRAVGLGAAVRGFAADVRVQMHQREAELRGVLEAAPMAGAPGLPAGRRRAIDPPHGHHTDDTYDTDIDIDTDKDGH